MDAQKITLAARLGTTAHISGLRQKARRLGLPALDDLANEAVARGCYHYAPGFDHRLQSRPVFATGHCMKTITLSDEAYARIEAARRAPGESESNVVLRALQSQTPELDEPGPWRRLACTNAEERAELRRLTAVIEEEFERIEPEDSE